MALHENLEQFFRSDVRNAGRRFYTDEKVSASQPSELEVQAFVRGSNGFKVSLKTESFESGVVLADCTCPDARKGRLCKHVWAALLKTEEKLPDFLEAKTEIQKAESVSAATAATQARPPSETQVAAREAAQAKQAEYRKAQYQKQKERAREIRLAKKGHTVVKTRPVLPEDVEAAIAFFAANGFEIKFPMEISELALAKKQLSRVFHPDKGGSHDEILELNNHYDVLTDYLNS